MAAAQRATSALVASTRAADGRSGPARGLSSLLKKFPDDAQGEEGGRPRRVRSPTGRGRPGQGESGQTSHIDITAIHAKADDEASDFPFGVSVTLSLGWQTQHAARFRGSAVFSSPLHVHTERRRTERSSGQKAVGTSTPSSAGTTSSTCSIGHPKFMRSSPTSTGPGTILI